MYKRQFPRLLFGFFSFFFFLCLPRDFSHLCQLLLQLYISMKSLSCLWHKVCSHRILMQQMQCFVSRLHSLESLSVGGMIRAKKENRLRKKAAREAGILAAHLPLARVVHQLSAPSLCVWQWVFRNKRHKREVEPKLLLCSLCRGWTLRFRSYQQYWFLGQILCLLSLFTLWLCQAGSEDASPTHTRAVKSVSKQTEVLAQQSSAVVHHCG